MLAQRLPGILPPLSYDEMIELTKIYSISGLLDVRQPLMTSRPFRCPDTKVTPAALAGGGKKPMPGEVSLAHLGVLFLDETPEFSRESLETLRGPMEAETVTISRTGGRYIFPAKFLTAAVHESLPLWLRFRSFPGVHLYGVSDSPLPGAAVRSVSRPDRSIYSCKFAGRSDLAWRKI